MISHILCPQTKLAQSSVWFTKLCNHQILWWQNHQTIINNLLIMLTHVVLRQDNRCQFLAKCQLACATHFFVSSTRLQQFNTNLQVSLCFFHYKNVQLCYTFIRACHLKSCQCHNHCNAFPILCPNSLRFAITKTQCLHQCLSVHFFCGIKRPLQPLAPFFIQHCLNTRRRFCKDLPVQLQRFFHLCHNKLQVWILFWVVKALNLIMEQRRNFYSTIISTLFLLSVGVN